MTKTTKLLLDENLINCNVLQIVNEAMDSVRFRVGKSNRFVHF